jgi:chemotaxis signal transduction protein
MYVAFLAAGRRWVLPAAEVAAVGDLPPVTRLPTRDPGRLGLAVHRGRVVALLAADGASAEGGTDGGAGLAAAGAARHLVVLRAGGESVALAAEELLGLKVEYGEVIPEGFALYPGLPPGLRP